MSIRKEKQHSIVFAVFFRSSLLTRSEFRTDVSHSCHDSTKYNFRDPYACPSLVEHRRQS
jgi:hypothetical protein